MKANKARALYLKYKTVTLKKILNTIKDYAENGRDTCIYDEYFTDDDVSSLKHLGYEVFKYGGKGTGYYYLEIKW